ncbi:MAG: hypothetical protein WBL61_01360 [Bryobacteraceae bacterium]
MSGNTPVSKPDPEYETPRAAWERRWVAGGLVCLLISQICQITRRIIDPDLWHELALAREIVRLHYVPTVDSFSYLPTIPVVDHEWGAGIVALFAFRLAGFPAIMVLNLALACGALLLAAVRPAGRRSHPGLVAICGLVVLPLLARGFPPVRAQAYSFLFFVALLWAVEAGKGASRKWLLWWLPVYVLWLNIHASFVLAFAVVGLSLVVAVFGGRAAGGVRFHLFLLAAMAALISVNPYGPAFYARVLHGVAMQRHLIGEWGPVWDAGALPSVLPALPLTVVGLLYAFRSRRFDVHGAAVLLVIGTAACLHTKLLPYYGFAWLFYCPGWIQGTALAREVTGIAKEHRRTAAILWCGIAVVAAAGCFWLGFWRAEIPERPAGGAPYYPVRAVDFLRDRGFKGNLMTPFNQGAYVSWRLYPNVRVSMDSRYETAFPESSFLRNQRAYSGDNWEAFASQYPADAILSPRDSALQSRLERSQWAPVYCGPSFSIFARPGGSLASGPRRPCTTETK